MHKVNCNFSNYFPTFYNSSLYDYHSQDLISRIKEVVFAIINKISDFTRSLEKYRQTNLKSVAMIGCVCLIILLAISFFKRKGEGINFPPTPLHRSRAHLD